MDEAKNYLKVMVLVASLAFCINASINYVVDPYWQFGFASSNTIIGINNRISVASMRHVHSDLMLGRQKKVLEKSLADTVLIGSSRSLYGLDTCGYNNIQKIAMPGINSSQMMQLFEVVLIHSNFRYVFIELGSLIRENRQSDNISFTPFEALWSVHVLTRSLSNLVASVRLPHQSDPLCIMTPSGSRSIVGYGELFESNRERYQSVFHKLNTSDVKQVVDKIAHQCRISDRAEGNPLSVVIYLAPVYPSLLNYEALPILKKAVENSIALSDFSKRCAIEIYIFQKDERFYQNENWFDLNHYKPSIGNRFLSDMLTGIQTDL